ncbi:hypothetical protein K474DRAFT_1711657 [Panus rudis PR-1116 ss-1]|nr:hypothetical protein K474DRAFT_1711657 [Panus rudis PR-1116 ss-1]
MSSQSSSGSSIYVPLPIARSQSTLQSAHSKTPVSNNVAEMIDEDNMAWGKPKKTPRRR